MFVSFFFGGVGSDVQKCHIFGIQMFCHEKHNWWRLRYVFVICHLSSDVTSKTYM